MERRNDHGANRHTNHKEVFVHYEFHFIFIPIDILAEMYTPHEIMEAEEIYE